MFSAIVAFLKNIGAIVYVMKALIDLIREFQRIKDAQREAESEKKRLEREKAIDEQQKAQNEEEFDRAQDDIVRNKP